MIEPTKADMSTNRHPFWSSMMDTVDVRVINALGSRSLILPTGFAPPIQLAPRMSLQLFGLKERVDRWEIATQVTAQGPEACYNMLTLQAHAYWNAAYFALKPIKKSDDGEELTVQFFWLAQRRA
jgi:hypothetical protein